MGLISNNFNQLFDEYFNISKKFHTLAQIVITLISLSCYSLPSKILQTFLYINKICCFFNTETVILAISLHFWNRLLYVRAALWGFEIWWAKVEVLSSSSLNIQRTVSFTSTYCNQWYFLSHQNWQHVSFFQNHFSSWKFTAVSSWDILRLSLFYISAVGLMKDVMDVDML